MAHVGRAYPLYWRRDLNLNLQNYQGGLASFYKMRPFGLAGSVGTALNGSYSPPGTDDDAQAGRMEWTTDLFAAGGQDVRWVFRGRINHMASRLEFQVELLDDSDSTLFRSRWGVDPDAGFGNVPVANAGPEVETTGVITNASPAGLTQCTALQWSELP